MRHRDPSSRPKQRAAANRGGALAGRLHRAWPIHRLPSSAHRLLLLLLAAPRTPAPHLKGCSARRSAWAAWPPCRLAMPRSGLPGHCRRAARAAASRWAPHWVGGLPHFEQTQRSRGLGTPHITGRACQAALARAQLPSPVVPVPPPAPRSPRRAAALRPPVDRPPVSPPACLRRRGPRPRTAAGSSSMAGPRRGRGRACTRPSTSRVSESSERERRVCWLVHGGSGSSG